MKLVSSDATSRLAMLDVMNAATLLGEMHCVSLGVSYELSQVNDEVRCAAEVVARVVDRAIDEAMSSACQEMLR